MFVWHLLLFVCVLFPPPPPWMSARWWWWWYQLELFMLFIDPLPSFSSSSLFIFTWLTRAKEKKDGQQVNTRQHERRAAKWTWEDEETLLLWRRWSTDEEFPVRVRIGDEMVSLFFPSYALLCRWAILNLFVVSGITRSVFVRGTSTHVSHCSVWLVVSFWISWNCFSFVEGQLTTLKKKDLARRTIRKRYREMPRGKS